MKPFMDENFLLSTETARVLFHEAAKDMPIIDYHCHLQPREIAQNIKFDNITHLMLGGDHYKWRAMLSWGVEERLIRGDGDPKEKFIAFADTVAHAIGNPLYHWTHLELQRVFGVDTPLNKDTASEIYDYTSELLQQDDFRAQALVDKFNVDYLCTTDDPVDDLSFHQAIAAEGKLKARVLPTFRPDKAVNVDRAGFADYIQQLSRVAGMEIKSTADVLTALERRVEYFHALGARISDHGMDTVPYGEPSFKQADKAFKAAMAGEEMKQKHIDSYRTVILAGLGAMYAQRGWTQQYHMSAMRNNNTAMFRRYGPDVGFDSITDQPIAHNLSRLMDLQDTQGQLPKTILYCLNGAANGIIGTMLGNFQQGGIKGKIQMGSGWWFMDQKDGMEDQLHYLANLGVLGTFVGMLTDSRSFISYPRHEYFRRILCNVIGNWVENGEYPADMETLKGLVRDICYNNAKEYFGI
ncbi:MAG: glucuronate isomerase [Clostridia bacterium]|nr:glucuronate isomerase [Clostridiales bacterium]MBQ6805392.1 glucuronate isomerase [Clostridia bacterium]